MSNESKAREAHPAAELFPIMPMDELRQLADDIKQNGLRDAIELLDGKILDGRNRLKACEIAEVEPRYAKANLNGSSATLYVASKNLHRRHLTLGQRAAIGAEMMPMLREEAKQRMQKGGRNGGHSHGQKKGVMNSSHPFPAGNNDNDWRGKSRAIAASAVKIGESTIQLAAAVMNKDREIFERVKRGEMTVNTAYRKTMEQQSAPPAQKPAVPALQGKRKASWEKAETERMVSGLAQIGGMCRGLGLVKMERLRLTAADRAMWAKTCYESARALQHFARKVRQAS